MNLCPDCPDDDPQPSIDQRSWVKDGRCHTCHDQLMWAREERKAIKRANKYHTPRTVNWLT